MYSHLLRRRGLRAAILAFLVCVLAAGSTSAAPLGAHTTTYHYLIKGGQASALWFQDDPNGCGVTFLELDSFPSVTLAGQSTAVPFVGVTYDKIDTCSGTELSGLGFATIPASAAQVNGPNPYLSASLSPTPVSVPLTDANGLPGPTLNLTVSGTWASTTTPNRFLSTSGYLAPGAHLQAESFGEFALGTATAQVMLGGTNLTPLPSSDGNAIIAVELDGSLTVTK